MAKSLFGLVSNVFVKIPEDSIGVDSLLSEAGKQLDPVRPASDLCLLDSKLVLINPTHTQARGELLVK